MFFSFPESPDRLWGQFSHLFHEYQGSFTGLKRPGREFTTPLHIPLWHGQGQLYLYFVPWNYVGGVELSSKHSYSWHQMEWMASVTSGRFIPGKRPRYPLNRRLGGSQSRSGRFAEAKPTFSCQDANPESSSPRRSHYTDGAISAPVRVLYYCQNERTFRDFNVS